MSLKRQAIQSVFWTIGDTFFLSGLSFAASVVLARLLGPAEFGLMGMIAVFIAVGASLVDSGMTASLIRTKDADNDDYSTVFLLNLGISFLVYLIAFFTAPYIADFFGQEVLKNIIRVYSISFIITAFSAVQLARLNKEMQFRRIMLLNLPGTILGVILGIVLGYKGFGAWSIVCMYLVTRVSYSIILWINASWKPQFKFSVLKAKEHFNFGYKLMVSGLINTIFGNLYNVIIGKYFPIQTLGHYERARTFNSYPVMAFTTVIEKVTYPLLSKMQDNKAQIELVYKQILQFVFFVSAPLMLGAAAVARPLFILVLGKEWVSAIDYFQVLCLAGMLYPIHAFNINILKVFGRSDLFLKLEIIKKTITVIGISFAFQFGIMGLVWSGVFTSFIALLINMYYCNKMINYKTLSQLRDMMPTFLISGFMFLIMNWMANANWVDSLSLKVILSVIAGASIYFCINLVFRTPPYLFLIEFIKDRKIKI